MSLETGLLGGGSWGTTMAALIARNAPVTMWARNPDTVEEINSRHTNTKYLPDARLPKAIKATADIEEAVAHKDVIVMGVPSHSFRDVLEQIKPHVRPWVPIISLSKGLELSTRKRMTQLINEVLPGHPAGVLTGPNLAREIMAGYAAGSVVAMEDEVIVRELQKLFHSGLFRVYTNLDVIGCELGGVLKNIIAIAAGMGDGLGAGDNTRSAVITRGLAEITRLGVAMGGKRRTFAGLAGTGDLIATCTSPQSRNRTVGYELGKGRSIEEITDEMFMVAEGVNSAPAVMALADEHGVNMPIAREVFQVVQGRRTPREAFRGLLRTAAGSEADPG
ncbi:MAG TPA: NAD(P)H-dependent glycerol-3-phosphate dehydrogenase [Woeseiaceae bacterium]|jgi:glycerol-3-phosphate dehydrogenase (NAD(P)+)|nr:NAD(P)H-dependent glycerol-3-phosphate dehydrogenase [Woeseiaceae bacterium]